MVDSIRISICQIRPVLGDFEGNIDRIVAAHGTSVAAGAALSVFPRSALCGPAPRDLLLRDDFLDECSAALERLVAALDPSVTAMVGTPVRGSSGELYDAVAVIRDRRIDPIVTKVHPGSGGYQQDLLYFSPGSPVGVTVGGVDVLVAVGDELVEVVENADPSAVPASPRIIVNPTASHYTVDRLRQRWDDARSAAALGGMPVVVVNAVGGNDEFVFDGGSLIVDRAGGTVHPSVRFAETVDVVDVPLDTTAGDRILDGRPVEKRSTYGGSNDGGAVDWADVDWGDVWSALVMGIADYVELNGFRAVGLGLSGGVDSALVATLAAEAVGADRVHCVMMPSRYSSEGSVTDATALAVNLGVDHRVIPIEPAHSAFAEMITGVTGRRCEGLTDENLQARVRGTTLMALSNEFGWLILVGSNRSESLVGYSTLYGDSAGGLAPISDVYKLGVYQLCRWYNDRCARTGSGAVIPESILTKAPSAELRPGQRDDQSLPSYDVLDPLLQGYVDQRLSRDQLVERGFDPTVVDRVVRLVDRSEYKRRQAPPTIRITRGGPSHRSDLPLTRPV